MRVKFGDVVRDVKTNVNPDNYEYYIAGDHMDTEDVHITRRGQLSDGLTGSAFTRLFKKGQVLYGSRRTYLKKCAVADFDGICANTTFVLESNDNTVLLNDLLPFLILSDRFTEHSIKKSRGSVNPYVLFSDIAEFEFDLPSIGEQCRLAEVLWAFDNAKQAYKKLLKLTDELVKSRFVELFGDMAINQKGWKQVTLRETSTHISDGPFGSNLKSAHYAENGVRVIRLQNIGVSEFLDNDKAYIPLEHYETLKKHTCVPGDVLIGTLGEPNLRACILPGYIEMAINKADCVHFVPNADKVNACFVCHYINQPATLALAGGSIHGQTRARISMSQVAALPIYLPPLDLQNRFAAFAEAADKSKFELQRTLDELDATYKAMLKENLGGDY